MSECALTFSQAEPAFDIVKDIHKLAQAQRPMSSIACTLTSSCTSSFIYGCRTIDKC
ncbi:hypothetical protein KSP39_PZI019775 [Platanthera zijinensis]|uniref:Uncharacterized protein n=1 Tax=Platanthera zijinensis TaxID=2320716 RepID=A0AAP0B2D0_9ASPA